MPDKSCPSLFLVMHDGSPEWSWVGVLFLLQQRNKRKTTENVCQRRQKCISLWKLVEIPCLSHIGLRHFPLRVSPIGRWTSICIDPNRFIFVLENQKTLEVYKKCFPNQNRPVENYPIESAFSRANVRIFSCGRPICRSCAFWSTQKRLVKVSENQKRSSGCFACHANQNGPILTEEFSSAFSHVFRTTSGADIAISACWNNLRGWVAIWRLHGVCDEPKRFWLLFVNRRTVSEVQNHTNLAIFNVLAGQDQPAWNTLLSQTPHHTSWERILQQKLAYHLKRRFWYEVKKWGPKVRSRCARNQMVFWRLNLLATIDES